jgi:hypothetical protein
LLPNVVANLLKQGPASQPYVLIPCQRCARAPARRDVRQSESSMHDSVAAKLGRATCSGLKVAFWNVFVDAEPFQGEAEHRLALQSLEMSVFELADTCHVVGISELHPRHASWLQGKLTRRRPQLSSLGLSLPRGDRLEPHADYT